MALLAQKLAEETEEFLASPSVEELADIAEVLGALAQELGGSFESLEAKRRQKRLERGGFDDGLVLVEICS